MEGSGGKPLRQKEKENPFDSDATFADWRPQLNPMMRQLIIDKINETLRMFVPTYAPMDLPELKKIAARIEEKIYITATNQADYLDKISWKLFSMETKFQDFTGDNPLMTVLATGNQNPPGLASLAIQPQASNLGQSSSAAVANQSPVTTLLLQQNFPNSAASVAIQGSACPAKSLPSASGSSSSAQANAGKEKSKEAE